MHTSKVWPALTKPDFDLLYSQHAGDLPSRDYGTPCDPFVRVSLRRDRRSLRKRTKQVLAEFNSEVVKKEANPNFNGEVFRTHVTPMEYKVEYYTKYVLWGTAWNCPYAWLPYVLKFGKWSP